MSTDAWSQTTQSTRSSNQNAQGSAAGDGLNVPDFSAVGNQGTDAATNSRFNLGEGFTGRGAAAEGFVGNRAADGQTSTGQRQTRQLGGNRNSGGARGTQARGGSVEGRRVVRPRVRVGFSYTIRPAPRVTQSLQSQFTRISARSTGLQGVNVAVDTKGMATLTGTVDSAESARLAVNIVRLEAGVRKVTNNLSVATATPQ